MNRKLILSIMVTASLISSACTKSGPFLPHKVQLQKKPTLNIAKPQISETVENVRFAAENLIKNITYARIALGKKDRDMAFKHIDKAIELNNQLKNAKSKYLYKSNVIAGEFTYDYKTDFIEHYVPLNNELNNWQISGNGPDWAKNSRPKIISAKIVYLSPNINTGITETKLVSARETVFRNEINDAQETLASLINDIVQMGQRIDSPMERARYNIALAHYFLHSQNYDVVGSSMWNAKRALYLEMNYEKHKKHHQQISDMLEEMKQINKMLKNVNPAILSQIDSKLEKWWKDLKDWSRD